MIVVLLALAGLSLFGMKLHLKGISPDYLTVSSTRGVKGVFVALVFLRHFKSCVTLSNPLDQPFLKVNNWLGQLIVALFLFYSGFGVMTSFQKKGVGYLKTIPKRRVLRTLLHFDLAVLLYLLADLALGIRYSGKRILSAFLAWESIGNSNWFIWVILMLYLLSWLLLRLIPSKPAALGVMTGVLVGYVLLFHHLWPDSWWWYDTVFCYPAGMGYALYRSQIEKFLSREWRFWAIFGVLLAGGGLLFHWRWLLPVYEALAVVFCLLGVLTTMKVSIGNRALNWLGERVFPIYILQRLPMLVLGHFGLGENPYLFFALTLPLTLLLAYLYDLLLKKLDNLLFKPAPGKGS